MPDLFPEPARTSTPGLDAAEPAQESARGLSAEPAALPEAERSPYRAVFADTFGQAYDTTAEPARGARVMADVSAEARTFGDEWTVQSLAAERFGAATRPQFNDWLAASLRTEAGEQAVLHAEKDGAPTPDRALGNDLVVLLDREGACGIGQHVAVMIGDDSTGWRLYSKDGSAGHNPTSGPSTWTSTGGRTNQTSGPLYAEFDTLDQFFSTRDVSDRFEAAVRVEVAGDDTPSGDRARAAAERIIREPYGLSKSSCATAVVAALEGAGVEGLSITESRATLNPFDGDTRYDARRGPIWPADVLKHITDLEGGDDAHAMSDTQRAWFARTGRREPGDD